MHKGGFAGDSQAFEVIHIGGYRKGMAVGRSNAAAGGNAEVVDNRIPFLDGRGVQSIQKCFQRHEALLNQKVSRPACAPQIRLHTDCYPRTLKESSQG